MGNAFDAVKEKDRIVNWIRQWFENNGPRAGAVIGISGGKDSTIAAAILCEALGPERVYGVLMPDGEQADIADSKKVCEFLKINASIINIKSATDGFKDSFLSATDLNGNAIKRELGTDAKINTPPRIRMATLYAVAQSLPCGGRVINTCNRSEDYIGYSTKYGDAAGDVSLFQNYTVREVRAIGEVLGVPHELIYKTPSDGLCGLSDEDKIGFTYDMLDDYILEGVCGDEEIKAKIDRMHVMNLHKLRLMETVERDD